MASDNVQVVIRVRPLITREKIDGAKELWQTQQDVIYQKDGSHQYRFDKVFSQAHDTDDVYDHVLPIIKACMDGINGTVFAYGQTASGKTYTMTGDVANPGIIPLTVEEVFNTIENSPDREFLIRFSFMEIYNENVVDLLGDMRKHLEVREDAKSNIFVDGLTEEIVTGPEQVMKMLGSGENKRHYGSTNMNERSSRSHTIFKLIIESRQQLDNTRTSIEQTDDAVKVSTLNLVDLAGSEKAKHTGATGQRLAEGGFINKSLLHLSSVISQLSENASFISYRDSRLTRILQNSLGGNSKTAIICNVTTAALEETLSTLRFATSAKRIKNKPKVNEVLSDDAMLKRCKKEIAALKKTLREMKQTDVGVVQEEKMELQLKLEEEQKFRQEQESKIGKLTELICVSSRSTGQTPKVQNKKKRRETWCPGKARKSMAAGLLSQANQAFAMPVSAAKPHMMSVPRRKHHLDDKNVSFNVMSNSVHEVIGEESNFFQEDNDSFQKLQEPLAFDDSCFVKPSLRMCNADCQTEDALYEIGANEDNVDLLLQLEAFKSDLLSGETRITELCQQLMDKDEELTSLNLALDKQIEAESSLNAEIYRLQGELRAKQDVEERGTKPVSDKRDSLEMMTAMTSRVEQLEMEKLELQKSVNEACNISQSTMYNLETSNKSLEELRAKYRHLETEYHDMLEEYQLKERELEELGEFRLLEEDYRNMSILEKQEKKKRLSSQMFLSPERASDDALTKLQKKVLDLEKDRSDAEGLCLHTKKQLAQSQDETKLLEQEFSCIKDTVIMREKEIQRLENEKKDFDLVMEMEVNKYKRRESELTDQLSSAYGEMGNSRTSSVDIRTDTTELQCKLEQLKTEVKRLEEENGKISEESKDLKNKLEEMKHVQEKLDKTEEGCKILEEQCSELRVSKEQLEDDIQGLQRELQSYSHTASEVEDLRTSNQRFVREIEDLKEHLDVHQKSGVELRDLESNNHTASEMEDLRTSNQRFVREIEDLKEQLDSQQKSVVDTRDLESNSHTASEMEDLRTSNQRFKKEIEDLKEQLDVQQKSVVDTRELQSASSHKEKEQEQVINTLRAQLQSMQAQCGSKDEISGTELNQTVDCSYMENQMKLLNARPTKDGSKKSVFDEMADLTMELTGMFPQRALQDTTVNDLDLEAFAAMKEQQQDVEFQLKQCQEELCAARERQVEMADTIERLEKDRHTPNERVEGITADTMGEIGVSSGESTGEKEGVDQKDERVENDNMDGLKRNGDYSESSKMNGDNMDSGEMNRADMEGAEVIVEERVERHGSDSGGVGKGGDEDWVKQRLQLEEQCEALSKELMDTQTEKEGQTGRIEELEHSVTELEQKLQSQSGKDGSTDFDKRITEIRDLAMEKLEEAKAMYKKEQDKCINQLTVNHKKDMDHLETEHKGQLEQLQQGHQTIVEELKEQHATSLSKASSSHSSELADQIIDKLKREIGSLQDELSVAENVMVMKESELEALEEKYTETVQRLKDEMHESQAGLATRHREAVDHIKEKNRAETEEMTEQLNSLCEKYNELLDSKDLQGQEKLEIERLESRLKALQTEKEELVLKLEDTEAKVKDISKGKQDLELKYTQDTVTLTEEMNAFKQEKEAQLEICNGQISELEGQLRGIRAEVKSVTSMFEERKEELEVAVEEKEREISEKDKLIAEGRGTLKKLQGELEGAKEALRDCEVIHKEKLGSLESEKCRLKLDNEKYCDEVEHLRCQVSDTYCVNKELDRLKRSLQEVREEREVLCGEAKGYKEEVDRLRETVREQEAALEGERQALVEAQDKVEVMESTISKGYAMVQQYEHDTQELQEECEKMREEKEQLEQKYEDLMDKYDSHLDEIRSDHEADIQTYTDRNAELQTKYEAVCMEYEQIKTEIEKTTQEQVEEYLTQVTSLEQEIEELRTSHAEEQVHLKQELLDQQQKLEGQLRDVELEYSGLECKLKALEVERDNTLLEQEWKLQKELSKKEEAVALVQREKDLLKEQIEEWKQTVEQLKTQVNDGIQALKAKEDEVVSVREELKESEKWHEEEEDRLKRFIDEAEDELEQSKRECGRLEDECDNIKKKQINETSMSFSSAEDKYRQQFEKLKHQYEQEIARLRRVGTETHSDLNASVCQLKEEKSRLGALQDAIMKKERENEALRATLRKSNDKVQALQTDLKEVEEAAEEEAEHLKSCVDSAEDDLSKKSDECDQLEEEIEKLKQALGAQAGTEKLVKVEKERDELKRQVCEKKMQLVMLNAELMKIADPLKREIKYLKGDNASMRDQVQRFKNEIRRLKNNQQDDSVVCERPQQSQGASGVVQEVIRFTLEAEKKSLEREVERLKKTNESNKDTISGLKQHLSEKDSKLANYKKYYKKQLTNEEKNTLRDIVNSPRPEVEKGRGGENKARGENWLDMSSWLVKDSKPATFNTTQDEADQCKQQ